MYDFFNSIFYDTFPIIHHKFKIRNLGGEEGVSLLLQSAIPSTWFIGSNYINTIKAPI